MTTYFNAMAVAGFAISFFSLAITLYSRGQVAGRTVSAIEQSNANQREMNSILQNQALAMEKFGLGMQRQGDALQAVAEGFREFAGKQADTNREVWQAIQLQSGRINTLAEAARREI